MLLNRFVLATPDVLSRPTRRGRASLLAAGLAVSLLPVLGVHIETAFAGTPVGPTCSLTGVTGGTPTGVQLTAQDTTSGLKRIISWIHINSTPVFGTFTPGSTSPVSTDFTQISPVEGSSGSLTITNEAGQKTVCLAQFKTLLPNANSFATGFTFPQSRNTLAIQNGLGAAALTSVGIVVNGSPPIRAALTPGELFTQDLTPLLHNFPPKNTMTIRTVGPTGASAEAVVWGVGPFIGLPPPRG